MATNGNWQEFEGRALDPAIRLGKCLASSDHRAVFEAEYGDPQPKKAAVKLISVDSASAARQLVRVEAAARLSHPDLLRIFRCGLWPKNEPRVLYMVMEYAAENLGEVVPRRPLTPAEAQEVLGTALGVLTYLHAHGCVHEHLTPSNILAVDDQVKISSDGVTRIGDTPAFASADVYHPPEASRGSVTASWDVWALAVTMVQILTQQPPAWERNERRKLLLPAGLPEPFREIARNCLQDDPHRRWTVERIQARLASGASSQPAPPPVVSGADWGARRYAMPAAGTGVALVTLVVVLGLTHQRAAAPNPGSATQPVPAARGVIEKERPSPFEKGTAAKEGEAATPDAAPGAASPPGGTRPEAANAPDAVVRRVMPTAPARARDTIRGTVRVSVALEVDAQGNVKRANLESAGPSRYFAKLALTAARGWKFTPISPDGSGPVRSWILRFEFRRSGAEVQLLPGRAARR